MLDEHIEKLRSGDEIERREAARNLGLIKSDKGLKALLDAFGTGIGFMIALLMWGTIREVLGNGTILGVNVTGPNFEPWVIFVLPPGGFFTIGFILLGLNWYERRKKQRAAAVAFPETAATGEAA